MWDVREMARRSTPKSVFDYTDGGSMSESSLDRSRDAYRRVEFTPRIMRNVADVDLSTTILGKTNALPFVFAPTGFTRMMHHAGEPAVAAVAERAGIAYALSTLGTTSIEGLATATPEVRRWFQLYVSRDRSQAVELMRRAKESGYDSLILTVDTAVGGIRWREVRNGLTIPPQLTLRTILDMSRHPKWWANVLTTEPLTFASLSTTGGTVGDLLTRVFDPGWRAVRVGCNEWWTSSLKRSRPPCNSWVSPALINSTHRWFDCALTERIWAFLALERCGNPGVHGNDQACGA